MLEKLMKDFSQNFKGSFQQDILNSLINYYKYCVQQGIKLSSKSQSSKKVQEARHAIMCAENPNSIMSVISSQ